jgi:hypothetical protein
MLARAGAKVRASDISVIRLLRSAELMMDNEVVRN